MLYHEHVISFSQDKWIKCRKKPLNRFRLMVCDNNGSKEKVKYLRILSFTESPVQHLITR